MHKLERTHSFYDKCGNYEAVDTSFLASSDYFFKKSGAVNLSQIQTHKLKVMILHPNFKMQNATEIYKNQRFTYSNN